MLAQARTFLAATGYRGFANFDVKVDPRTGVFRFFEVNPRIGRNNYYIPTIRLCVSASAPPNCQG